MVLLVNAMCKKVCGRQVQILVLDTQDSNGMFRSYLGASKAAQSVGCLDILDARWLTISSIGPMVPFSTMHRYRQFLREDNSAARREQNHTAKHWAERPP